MFYSRAIRPLLFAVDAEFAHERALDLLAASGRLPFASSHPAFTHARLQTCVAGIAFPNPIGLAAGCDKNARAIPIWPRFGFGFVEAGTVTAQPQPGNPRPRVFRVPEQQALVNRLGFNSEGATVVANRLGLLRRSRPLPVPLGVNIGKTKLVTGDPETLEDYCASYRRLAPHADFVVVNVSSPNTPGLREWQESDKLRALLMALREEGGRLATATIPRNDVTSENEPADSADAVAGDERRIERSVPPLFLKISPDMDEPGLDGVLEVALEVGIAGIIATNTTTRRPSGASGAGESGGMSGRPLRDRAIEVLRHLYRRSGGKMPLIGVGGISTPEDVYRRLCAGASLVQLYTALVYEGPFLPRTLNEGLLRLMERDGVPSISDLVGCDA
jgi:dihydroorotate dehydrogenase